MRPVGPLAWILAAIVLPAPALGAINFQKSIYPVDNGPVSVLAAPVGMDTNTDLVVSNSVSGDITVLPGTGKGTFTAGTNFAAGASPAGLALGYFQSQLGPPGSNTDLIVANTGPNTASLLFASGFGTLSPATTVSVSGNPVDVASGSISTDGNLDFATANATGNNISVVLGTGSGFAAPVQYPAHTTPSAIVVTILNWNTFNRDILVTNFGSDDVTALPSSSAGTLGSGTNYATGDGPVGLAVSEFQTDGNTDVVTANQNDNTVSILPGDGSGGLGAPTSYPVGSQPSGVVVADFNADGKQDVATSNKGAGTVSVLLGTGAGTLGAALSFDAGGSPSSIATGDFNDDGLPDLVVTNQLANTVSVLINSALVGASPASLTFGSPTAVPQGTVSASQPATITNNGLAPLMVSGYTLTGANPDDWFVSGDTCRPSVAPGANCTVQLRFAPQAQGTRTATFGVITTTDTPGTVSLIGTGGALPAGAAGSNGAAGATGTTGATGAAGAPGMAGATGPIGPRGRPGRKARVTCRVVQKAGSKVTCTVKLTGSAGSRRIQARLTQGRSIYATGVVSKRSPDLRLHAPRNLSPGRYTLTLTLVAGHGHRVLSRTAVVVRR